MGAFKSPTWDGDLTDVTPESISFATLFIYFSIKSFEPIYTRINRVRHRFPLKGDGTGPSNLASRDGIVGVLKGDPQYGHLFRGEHVGKEVFEQYPKTKRERVKVLNRLFMEKACKRITTTESGVRAKGMKKSGAAVVDEADVQGGQSREADPLTTGKEPETTAQRSKSSGYNGWKKKAGTSFGPGVGPRPVKDDTETDEEDAAIALQNAKSKAQKFRGSRGDAARKADTADADADEGEHPESTARKPEDYIEKAMGAVRNWSGQGRPVSAAKNKKYQQDSSSVRPEGYANRMEVDSSSFDAKRTGGVSGEAGGPQKKAKTSEAPNATMPGSPASPIEIEDSEGETTSSKNVPGNQPTDTRNNSLPQIRSGPVNLPEADLPDQDSDDEPLSSMHYKPLTTHAKQAYQDKVIRDHAKEHHTRKQTVARSFTPAPETPAPAVVPDSPPGEEPSANFPQLGRVTSPSSRGSSSHKTPKFSRDAIDRANEDSAQTLAAAVERGRRSSRINSAEQAVPSPKIDSNLSLYRWPDRTLMVLSSSGGVLTYFSMSRFLKGTAFNDTQYPSLDTELICIEKVLEFIEADTGKGLGKGMIVWRAEEQKAQFKADKEVKNEDNLKAALKEQFLGWSDGRQLVLMVKHLGVQRAESEEL